MKNMIYIHSLYKIQRLTKTSVNIKEETKQLVLILFYFREKVLNKNNEIGQFW
jgi:hypothetical protein